MIVIVCVCVLNAVAPDAIHQHVKTCREGMKNTHFIAPEFGSKSFRQHLHSALFSSFFLSSFEFFFLFFF